ncbi:MAG: hypothetical protein M1820_002045 [Bogoriella megaspora]|nr:MAG: hypothetical protein M1820_002045 [Bogoriella megaspora]
MLQRLTLVLAWTLLFLPTALAVYADDAYSVDYHLALLGLPHQHTTFFQPPYQGSKASLLYSLSERNILGAINPKDGSIVWRQPLQSTSNATKGFLRASQDADTVVTAVDGQVAAWSASDGRAVWVHTPGSAPVHDLEILEIETGKARTEGGKDAILLVGGSNSYMKRIDGTTGRIRWEYEDTSGDAPLQVSVSPTSVYYIATHTTLIGGIKIKVVSLDPITGLKLDQQMISSDSDLSSIDGILFVGANTASPIIAWTDKAFKTVKINVLGSKQVSSFNVENSAKEEVERIDVIAPHKTHTVPHFLIHYQSNKNHWADVFHVNLNTASITKAYSLPKLAGRGAFATTTSDANVYFTRVTESDFSVVSSASHGILGRWQRKGRESDPGSSLQPIHAAAELVTKSGTVSAIRCAVLFEDGDWALFRNGELSWTRHEGLASATYAIWAEAGNGDALAEELKVEGHANPIEAYIHRLKRHVHDLQSLPEWLQSLPRKLLRSFGGPQTEAESLDIAGHDRFGYHKYLVVANEDGYVFVFDAGTLANEVKKFRALFLPTGQKWTRPNIGISFQGDIFIQDPTTEQFLNIPNPFGKELKSPSFSPPASALSSMPLIVGAEYIPGKGVIVGRGTVEPEPLWQFKPSAGERIVDVSTRETYEPVASIGKALGDRRVLYKHINPNVMLVIAANDASHRITVYLLESVSGVVLYSNTHSNVDATRHITSAVSENWFSYSFTLIPSTPSSSAGHVLVIAELYESSIPNDRGSLGDAANFSAINYASSSPEVIEQTFHISEEISSMAVTQTKQGITSRDLLAVLPSSNSIILIPRAVLDPRRPVGRNPTKDEAAEGLFQYAPVLEFDPKWYINHKREVLGTKKVLTTPSGLESTSLVFAYGGDVFGTRVNPSGSFDVLGKGFGKLQMCATVAALGVGVFVVAPLVSTFIPLRFFTCENVKSSIATNTTQVKRKQINAQWQVS